MVWNYQNADCSSQNKFTVWFIIISASIRSFPVGMLSRRSWSIHLARGRPGFVVSKLDLEVGRLWARPWRRRTWWARVLSANIAVLFRSSAVLDPRVGHTMDVLSPFIPVLCHSDWLFHGESCPRLDVVHPGCAWSSSSACTCHCSLHYLFLQATPLVC